MSDIPAISTKDTLGEYDAIESAKPGEPLFPIQGGDPFGPETVLHWVELCRAAGRAEEDETKAAAMLRKATNAELVAWAMQAYQRNEYEADTSRVRSTYSDKPLLVKTETQTIRASLIQSVSVLHNAISQIVNVADLLTSIDEHESEAKALRRAANKIIHITAIIEPRRGNERT